MKDWMKEAADEWCDKKYHKESVKSPKKKGIRKEVSKGSSIQIDPDSLRKNFMAELNQLVTKYHCDLTIGETLGGREPTIVCSFHVRDGRPFSEFQVGPSVEFEE